MDTAQRQEEWVSAKLPSEDVRKLEELAKENDRSRSAELRRATREHIKRHSDPKQVSA